MCNRCRLRWLKKFDQFITDSLNYLGAVKTYDGAIGPYQELLFVPNLNAGLGDFVFKKSIGGIFYYLTVEEAAIRSDPAKRTI